MVITAFLIGFIGSLHCVGMCGPIALMLPLNREHKGMAILQTLSYHMGRIFSYVLIGLLVGMISRGLEDLFKLQQYISMVIGIFILIIIIFPALKTNPLFINKYLFKWINYLKLELGQRLKQKSPQSFFMIGFFNGWLPCGLVYLAAFGAMATFNYLDAVLYMAVFGLGTIPILGVVFYFGSLIHKILKKQRLNVLNVMLFIVSTLFILRGLGLHIPYLSPDKSVTTPTMNESSVCP